MRISLGWLKKLISLSEGASAQQIAKLLTGLGLEVDSTVPVEWNCSRVVVGQIISAVQHSNADRLRVCQVSVGDRAEGGVPLQIVCGAPNARAGIKVAVALVGAKLPGGVEIKAAKLRGEESCGMLCSCDELRLNSSFSVEHGIIELAPDAPVGEDLAKYLGLPDTELEIEFTPNRGDCLSILGIAREIVAAESSVQWTEFGKKLLALMPPTGVLQAHDLVQVEVPELAPHYCLAKLKVNGRLATPDWMKMALISAGMRPVNLLVDITNYVMMEMGQPLHAFDAKKVNTPIVVRLNRSQETNLELLNHQTIELQPNSLVIADSTGPLALAGVMGGLSSAVSLDTDLIFLESAFFQREKISREVQGYSLSTDSSYRFERGVDYLLPPLAMQRAIDLFTTLAEGEVQAVQIAAAHEHLPVVSPFELNWARVVDMLGEDFVSMQEAQAILARLSVKVEQLEYGRFRLTPPSYRFDLQIEEDAIEEIARVVGYNKLAVEPIEAELSYQHLRGHSRDLNRLGDRLVSLGYSEAISYSFVDAKLQSQLGLDAKQLELANPIYHDSNVLRCSLWSGFLPLVQRNLQRSNEQLRLFELGRVFMRDSQAEASREGKARIRQPYHLAGVLTGDYAPKQWGEQVRAIDLYDLKNDLECVLDLGEEELDCREAALKGLHPGRAAQIYLKDQPIGYLGQLHPSLQEFLHLKQPVWLWEIDVEELFKIGARTCVNQEPSKYPKMVRDLALLVPCEICWQELKEMMRVSDGIPLVKVTPFDIYRGAELPEGYYGIAVRLLFRSKSETLTDQEVEAWIAQILDGLAQRAIKLRQ